MKAGPNSALEAPIDLIIAIRERSPLALADALDELDGIVPEELRRRRREKFRSMGVLA